MDSADAGYLTSEIIKDITELGADKQTIIVFPFIIIDSNISYDSLDERLDMYVILYDGGVYKYTSIIRFMHKTAPAAFGEMHTYAHVAGQSISTDYYNLMEPNQVYWVKIVAKNDSLDGSISTSISKDPTFNNTYEAVITSTSTDTTLDYHVDGVSFFFFGRNDEFTANLVTGEIRIYENREIDFEPNYLTEEPDSYIEVNTLPYTATYLSSRYSSRLSQDDILTLEKKDQVLADLAYLHDQWDTKITTIETVDSKVDTIDTVVDGIVIDVAALDTLIETMTDSGGYTLEGLGYLEGYELTGREVKTDFDDVKQAIIDMAASLTLGDIDGAVEATETLLGADIADVQAAVDDIFSDLTNLASALATGLGSIGNLDALATQMENFISDYMTNDVKDDFAGMITNAIVTAVANAFISVFSTVSQTGWAITDAFMGLVVNLLFNNLKSMGKGVTRPDI